MPSLVLLKSPEGASPGKNIPLNGDHLVIGRDESVCQIVIPHHAVSRKHALITRSDGQFFIEDLKSRNLTYVNSKVVPPPVRQPLKHETCSRPPGAADRRIWHQIGENHVHFDVNGF